MNVNYSSILTKAWTTAWKYKVLWIFGFLVLLGGGGNGLNISSNGSSGNTFRYDLGSSDYPSSRIPSEVQFPSYSTGYYPSYASPEVKNFFDQIARVDINTWIAIGFGIVCCLALLWVIFQILSIIGTGGLIGGIVKADATGTIGFREAWGMGLRYFWKILLLRLLRFLVGLIVGLVIIVPGAILGVLTCGLGFIPLFCGAVVIGIGLYLLFLLMDYAVVVENLGIGEAIGRGWQVLRDHIGPAILFYLIQLAVSLGVGIGLLIFFVPSGLAIFFSFLPLITATGVLNSTLLVIGIVLLVAAVLISWIVQSIYTVWQRGVWAFAYQAFIAKPSGMEVAAVVPPAAPTAISN